MAACKSVSEIGGMQKRASYLKGSLKYICLVPSLGPFPFLRSLILAMAREQV